MRYLILSLSVLPLAGFIWLLSLAPAMAADTSSLSYFRSYPLAARGYHFIEAHEPQRALPYFQRAVDVDPQQVEYRIQLMLLQLKTKAYQDALKTGYEGLRYTPDNPDLKAYIKAAQASLDALHKEHGHDNVTTVGDYGLDVSSTPRQAPISLPTKAPRPAEATAQPVRPAALCNALRQKDSATLPVLTAMQAAFCQLDDHNQVAAQKVFEELLGRAELTTPERLQVLGQLGYLYADSGNYRKAAKVWGQVLASTFNPALALRRSWALRLSGKQAQASTVLAQIKPASLNPADHPFYNDEMARRAEHTGDLKQALAYENKAIRQEPTANRYYTAGLWYYQLHQNKAAITAFEAAVKRQPNTPTYVIALAYAYKADQQLKPAANTFAKVANKAETPLFAREDYAYTLKELGELKPAAQAFRNVIDHTAEPTTPLAAEDQWRRRREVQQLEDNWYAVGSATYLDGIARSTGAANVARQYDRSMQYGLEGVYMPTQIGHLRPRSVHVYGQVFASSDNSRYNLNQDSTQGAVGVRYKPFESQDMYLSAARLVKLGRDALNDWQARATYGYTTGFDMEPVSPRWDYTFVFLDASYLARSQQSFIGAEVRKGRSFNGTELWGNDSTARNWARNWILTPHVVLAGSHVKNQTSHSDTIEGGVGFSLKRWFNEDRYRAPRSSAELIAQWRQPIAGSTDNKGAPFIRFVVQY